MKETILYFIDPEKQEWVIENEIKYKITSTIHNYTKFNKLVDIFGKYNININRKIEPIELGWKKCTITIELEEVE